MQGLYKMRNPMLNSIIFILIGTLILLEGWKIHVIVSFIGFCAVLYGVHISNYSPKKLLGKVIAGYIIISLAIVGFLMIFPDIEKMFPSLNVFDLLLEFILGFMLMTLIIVFYGWLSSLWQGNF